MKLYKNRNFKNEIQCSYCKHAGHNRRFCPSLKKHYEANKNWGGSRDEVEGVSPQDFDFRAPISFYQARYGNYHSYAKKVFAPKPKSTAPKAKTVRSCGFCGGTGHTRRNCATMKDFVKVLEETNRAYREYIYDELLLKFGIGIGAYVEFEKDYGDSCEMGLITDFNLDSISIGNCFGRYSEYSTPISYKVGDRENTSTKMLSNLFDHNRPLLGIIQGYSHYRDALIVGVVAPCEAMPDKEWFLGQSPAFEWVVKKRDLNRLYWAYYSIIETFHPNGVKEKEKFRNLL